jgi:peptide/nickel transport system substrate-binding protein
MVKSVGPGYSKVTLVRNPYRTWEQPWAHNHGKPYLSTIVFQPVVQDATAVSELLTGTLDLSNVPGSQVSRLKGNSHFKLHHYLNQGEYFIEFNTSKPPFDKVAVRKAIAEAIDRKAIVQAALNGDGKAATSPIAQTLQYYDKQSGKYAPRFNPDDARRILAANHVTGPFTMLVYNQPKTQTAGELIQSELAQVGVKVNIVAKPLADFIAVAGKGQFDLNIFDYNYGDPDILYLYFHSSQEKAGYNYTFYKNPTLDSLIVQGRQSFGAKAQQAYVKAQRLMDRNVVVDPLWTDRYLYATNAQFHGWHPDSSGVPLYQDLYRAK